MDRRSPYRGGARGSPGDSSTAVTKSEFLRACRPPLHAVPALVGMAKGITAPPNKKRRMRRLSEHARLVEERARSIPPGVVHELFDTTGLPVPPPAPVRPARGRLVSKPPPHPPRPSRPPPPPARPGHGQQAGAD